MAALHTDELPSPEDILVTWVPKFALPNRPLEFEIGLRSDFPFVSEVAVEAAAKHVVAHLRIHALFRASSGVAEVLLVAEIVARRNPEGCLSWRATLPCLWGNDAESAAATVTVQRLFLGDAPIRSFSPAVVAVGTQRAIDLDSDFERGHPLVGHKVYAAALAGDVGALRRALYDGDHPEIRFSKAADSYALHACAAKGHVQATAELLNVVLDPQPRDDEGCTPLHYAAGNGHVEVVALFLADPRIVLGVVNNAGETALAYARTMGRHAAAALIAGDPRAL